MARPRKTGLSYFPKDTDYYGDYKIADLLNEYGPLGQTIYDVVLTMVYREGYYLAIPLDRLVTQIIRTIGNRWVKDKNLVLQVILFCGEIGLLHDDLLRQGVITSAGIQKRYAEVTVRNKVDKSKFWLLDVQQPGDSIPSDGINVAETRVNVAETRVNVAETRVNVAETPINQSKVNKSKSNQIKDAPAMLDALGDSEREIVQTIESRIIREPIRQHQMGELLELVRNYPKGVLAMAIDRTANAGGRSLPYLRKVADDLLERQSGFIAVPAEADVASVMDDDFMEALMDDE